MLCQPYDKKQKRYVLNNLDISAISFRPGFDVRREIEGFVPCAPASPNGFKNEEAEGRKEKDHRVIEKVAHIKTAKADPSPSPAKGAAGSGQPT